MTGQNASRTSLFTLHFGVHIILLWMAISPFAFTQTTTPQKETRIVVLGDSLTEGLGVPPEQAFPALLEKKLKTSGYPQVTVINSGISGSTTSSGISRFNWIAKTKPRLVVLALGANDGLRGMPISETKQNLLKVIQAAKGVQIPILLAGMKLPPNYGKKYQTDFENIFSSLSKETSTPLLPFLLEGIGGEYTLNQADGIHPNEKGHIKMANLVYDAVLKHYKHLLTK